jgi:hypothetical protein
VVDQHPDRDRRTSFAGNQPWQVVADRCVELYFAIVDLLQHSGSGERLGDAADAVSHIGRDGAAGGGIGDSGGAAPDLVVVAHLGENSGHARVMDGLQGGL